MLKIGLYLEGDSPEFEVQATEWSAASGATCFPFRDAATMIDTADKLPSGAVTTLAVFAHGTPCALGRPGRFGVDVRPARQALPQYASPEEFARAWAGVLAPGALVSLAACLCGRSQHWYFRQPLMAKLYGKVISPWGQESYEHGGATSLASALTKAFGTEGRGGIRIRAHCAAGHTTHQALLREFHPDSILGLSLFRIVLGRIKWTVAVRDRWQKLVKGERAERWLLGDNSVIEEIRRLW